MKTLDPISLPLNSSVLIEASAGTGKTYTMANLYLRLVLGVGCKAMNVEEILVVTFTKAATQELRDRIRAKLNDVGRWFQGYEVDNDCKQAVDSEPFLAKLYQAVKDNLAEALLRLRIAERDIDLASIFTIDSFCQQMLFQFAFDSGVRFDIDLNADEDELLTRLAEESWRELFYSLDETQAEIIVAELGSPSYALECVKSYLYVKQPELGENQGWLAQSLDEYLAGLKALVTDAKAFWFKNGEDIKALIQAEINKTYEGKVPKSLNRSSYKKNSVASWEKRLDEWAVGQVINIPADTLARFGQTMLIKWAQEGAEPLTDPRFEQVDSYLHRYKQQFEGKQKAILLYQFLEHLRNKLNHYKQNHKEKSFADMINFLHHALHGERAADLAKHIRHKFPFAMIDEFQDTNLEQYEIFSRIFMDESVEKQGFIMIGDPKQSIYKFRGADIFTYLNAAEQAEHKETLDRNWRSLPDVVECANKLFDVPMPFLYEGIKFAPVKSKETSEKLVGAESNQFFLQNEFDSELAAKQCAYQIQQQLKSAEQGKFYVRTDNANRAIEPQDIAVLVRSHDQAKLMRKALQECHIQSVFFAERESVYDTQEAWDLLLILKACLNPYHQSTLLATLGSQLWGENAQSLAELKQDERKWDEIVNCFAEYQSVWKQQGILPMLHLMFMQENIIQRINASENADRRITDLLHLAELLQGAMPNLENESALVRWYEQQLNNSNGQSDEQKLRLESEDSLVKIITIHGSKGLEYPVVWLPFVAKESNAAKNKAMVIYHDGKQHKWDFGSQSDEVKSLINKAEFAEDLRLLYVAVTRAKYQLNLILPKQLTGKWSAIGYLLTNGEMAIDNSFQAAQPTLNYIMDKGLSGQVWELEDSWQADDWRPTEKALPEIEVQEFNGEIKSKGLITSFTALHKQLEHLQNSKLNQPVVTFSDEALDRDKVENIREESEIVDEEMGKFSPYQFPHGATVGTILHTFFENWDFSQSLDKAKVLEICSQLNLSDEWIEPVSQWFERVAETPFAQGVSLKQINNQKCLNEWQFYLRLTNPTGLIELNSLLKKYSPLAKQLPDLAFYQLEGFVRGFVDCICEVDGKFYVIDYKSNFLGYLAQDYSQAKIHKAMGQYRYDLQYLLYTLAVHRYLKTRLGDKYDYERDFGGVAYLFLRGMNGLENNGVYFDKPSVELIEEMDKLFG
ncbi:exodeoxyribonuclease V subunit beta [Pasteurellaceae bacterium LFhippo2]|nr:exodeoxyribonuclease V subunit beta [Pasteurellaceae bacterium LFhippo2]